MCLESPVAEKEQAESALGWTCVTIVGQGNQLGQSWVCVPATPHRIPSRPSSYPEAPSFLSSVTLSFAYFRNPL